ncbi:MAG: TolC family protein [Bacteroidetes bacterium]|nr:TolC family protein [Bacteroidota bacterium]
MHNHVRSCIVSLLSLVFCVHVYGQECSLSGYLDKGVSNSPVLKDLANQVLANQCDSLVARASYLPQVNFNISMMYAPSANGWGYSEVITNGQSLAGTINVSQQIFNTKNRKANLEKYGLEAGNLANDRNISLGELKKAITAQYLAAFAALEELRFQQEIRGTLLDEARVLKAWTEKGIYRQTDYLSLQVEILNLERNIRDLDLLYRKEFWNLNLICGIGDTAACSLTLPVVQDTVTKPIENSLFFRRFMIDSLLIRNEQLLIDRRYQPVVSWFADGGIVNNEPRYLYQNVGISGGISMTLPVFDGNQRKISYNKIRMREETRRNYEENFRFLYQTQLKQLQAELEVTRKSARENEKQVSLVQQLVDADHILLNSGSLPISDYILALKNLVEARHAGLLYRIRTQYIVNEINFRKQ